MADSVQPQGLLPAMPWGQQKSRTTLSNHFLGGTQPGMNKRASVGGEQCPGALPLEESK